MKRHYVLSLAVLAAFLGLCTLLNVPAAAQEAKKVLHFTRSQTFEHDPAKLLDDGTTVSGRALKAYLGKKNIDVVETQDGGVFDGNLSQYDGFIFYTSGNLLNADGSKNDKAKPMTEAGLRKLIATVRDGKGFVGIHAATDSHSGGVVEDGVDIYTKLVGARFTSHGPQQFATITVVEPASSQQGRQRAAGQQGQQGQNGRQRAIGQQGRQPAAFPFILESGKRFTTWDEWYAMNQFNKDMHVILVQETAGMEGRDYDRPPFPASWVRLEGKGRVGYSSLGHDNRYFQNTENVRRIAELVEWSVGRFDVDTTPTIERVTPRYTDMPPPAATVKCYGRKPKSRGQSGTSRSPRMMTLNVCVRGLRFAPSPALFFAFFSIFLLLNSGFERLT
jgi:type 1 glutamine amidotransferase